MHYRLLGNLAVADDDGAPVAIPAAKRRALLAILLLHRGRPIQREALIDALWGESAPDAASKSLFAHVSRLRRELGASAIITVPGGYVLPLREDELDIVAFEKAVATGRRSLASRHWHAASAAFADALDRWSGPALAEFASEPFARPEIVRLEELRAGALEDRIDADLALHRERDLVPELEQLVEEHPLREQSGVSSCWHCTEAAGSPRHLTDIASCAGRLLRNSASTRARSSMSYSVGSSRTIPGLMRRNRARSPQP